MNRALGELLQIGKDHHCSETIKGWIQRNVVKIIHKRAVSELELTVSDFNGGYDAMLIRYGREELGENLPILTVWEDLKTSKELTMTAYALKEDV